MIDDAGSRPGGTSLDMIAAVVSVLQYVSGAELARLLETFHDKLKDDGLLVLGDVVPNDLSPIEDARALLVLRLSRRLPDRRDGRPRAHGFVRLPDAARRLRAFDHDEPEMRAILPTTGFLRPRGRRTSAITRSA